jgi:hypothetical protein
LNEAGENEVVKVDLKALSDGRNNAIYTTKLALGSQR